MIKVLTKFSICHLVSIFLVLAVIVYSAFSDPYPKRYGLAEIVIAFLLVSAITFTFVKTIKMVFNGSGVIPLFSFAWFLIVPTFIGVYRWAPGDILRDFIPFLYLFIPFFMIGEYRGRAIMAFTLYESLPFFFGIAGMLLSIRFFAEGSFSFSQVGKRVLFDSVNLTYYPYDPFVLFGAIFFLLLPFYFLNCKWSYFTKSLATIVSLCMFAICASSLAGIVQRAPLAMIVIMFVLFIFLNIFRYPVTIIIMGVVMLFLSFIFRDYLFGTLRLVIEKSSEVGVNGKSTEFISIIKILSGSIFDFMFGLGWGASYYNPVLKSDVRFSHNMISFYLLKSGMCGIMALFIYFYWLLKMYASIFFKQMKNVYIHVLLFSIISVLPINLLQATYKSLSFGLILSLIPFLYYRQQLHSTHTKSIC